METRFGMPEMGGRATVKEPEPEIKEDVQVYVDEKVLPSREEVAKVLGKNLLFGGYLWRIVNVAGRRFAVIPVGKVIPAEKG